jgi:hypothetical protein
MKSDLIKRALCPFFGLRYSAGLSEFLPEKTATPAGERSNGISIARAKNQSRSGQVVHQIGERPANGVGT